MQFCTGGLTGEILLNWSILSCCFWLLCWPLGTQSSEVPLDDILPCCSWATRSTLPMGWCSLVESLGDPVVDHTLKISKPLQSAFLMVFESTGCLVREHTYLFVICCDHTVRRIFLWHLISNAFSLASSLSVRLQDSAAYKSVERA